MKLEDALRFWISESGYRKIQNLLSQKMHKGVSKYALSNLINLDKEKDTEETEDAIETILAAMEPENMDKEYFRGSPSKIKNTHIREGFFSVTKDRKKAEAYGDVYRVLVDRKVPRLSFSAEGDETLIAPGMKYVFEGNTVKVSVPSVEEKAVVPLMGNLYSAKKSMKEEEEKKNILR